MTRLCLNIPDLAFQTLELQLLERAVLPISCRLGGCPWDAEGEKEGLLQSIVEPVHRLAVRFLHGHESREL